LSGKATRLYPLPVYEIPADAIYDDLVVPRPQRRDASRPYVIINMVSSADGKASVEGKASSLGGKADRQTMRNLRSKADAVMVGANTLRAEKVSLGLDKPPQGRQPLAVIVTGSGDLPLESNLVISEGQELVVVTSEGVTPPPWQRRGRTLHSLCVRADEDGNIDVQEALEVLKGEYGVNLLLMEGGPTLNQSLISSNLADELFLTLAPKLIGGPPDGALSILMGPARVAADLSLLSVHLAGEELFLRYSLGQST
jgi:2,5-diamino-6-(ribosylamino)-4(3H)-pyrimidinone 5'-phosphate reductase